MFLDIGLGILLSVFANLYFYLELNIFLVIFCITFTLLPDIDFLISLFTSDSNKIIHRHRDLLHYPLIFIVLGLFILFLVGEEWGILFIIGSILHFLHDSIGIGWGVSWLWPFSKNHLAFFRGSLKTERGGLPFKFLYIWTHEEVDKLMNKYGDFNWIRNIYFRPSFIFITEILFFLLSLVIFYFYIH